MFSHLMRRLFNQTRMGAILACCLAAMACSSFAASWPVENHWTAEEDQCFSDWIARISTAGSSWRSVQEMLESASAQGLNYVIVDDQKVNLWSPEDKNLPLRGVDIKDGKESPYYDVDCDGFPVVIRAYYSYKRNLPFISFYPAEESLSRDNATSFTLDNLSYGANPLALFKRINASETRMAIYRTAPARTDTFTYPISINRQAIRPGTLFFDTNGHLMVICAVHPDGGIQAIQGFVDGLVGVREVNDSHMYRNPMHSGGFRAYRAIYCENGKIFHETDNSKLPGYCPEPIPGDFFTSGSVTNVQIHAWVRETLRNAEYKTDPFAELRTHCARLSDAINGRIQAVDRGWAYARNTPVQIPVEQGINTIYNTTSVDWETFSTPGRDLRLRNDFLAVPRMLEDYLKMYRENPDRLTSDVLHKYRDVKELGQALIEEKDRLFSDPLYAVQYIKSDGQPSPKLLLKDIEERLFYLSFNPNHSPELRWGAVTLNTNAGKNKKQATYIARTPDESSTIDWALAGNKTYAKEQPLRNRLERTLDLINNTPTTDLSNQMLQVVNKY